MTHPALVPDAVAIVTGGASGIGLAAAERFAGLGLKLVIADQPGDRLSEAAARLAALSPLGADGIMAAACDVSDMEALESLQEDVLARFGKVNVLMNNAGIQPGSALFGPLENWSGSWPSTSAA